MPHGRTPTVKRRVEYIAANPAVLPGIRDITKKAQVFENARGGIRREAHASWARVWGWRGPTRGLLPKGFQAPRQFAFGASYLARRSATSSPRSCNDAIRQIVVRLVALDGAP